MATRAINVSNLVKIGEKYVPSTVANASSASGDFSVSFDDTKILNLNQFRHALDAAWAAAQGNSFFAKG